MTDANVPLTGSLSRTCSSLLVRAQAADEKAWNRLVAVYSPLVYQWCRVAGLQASDAMDVGQEVFSAVARKISDFRRTGPTDSFRGWLRTITRNKVRDFFRAQRNRPMAAGGSEALQQLSQVSMEETDEHFEHDEDDERTLVFHAALAAIREEFEPKTWTAFWSVVIEGQSPAEVAEKLCMTRNAVYLAKSRVMARLREEFDGLFEEDS